MSEISEYKKMASARKIVSYFKAMKYESEEAKILAIYNSAVDDMLGAIGIFADRNPVQRSAFLSLKEELQNWILPRPMEDKDE